MILSELLETGEKTSPVEKDGNYLSLGEMRCFDKRLNRRCRGRWKISPDGKIHIHLGKGRGYIIKSFSDLTKVKVNYNGFERKIESIEELMLLRKRK